MTPIVSIIRTREDLSRLFVGVGAEIGVEQGVFAQVICHTAQKLYCVDAWRAYRGYRDHTRQGKLDNFFNITKQRLQPYNVEYIRKFSMDAVKDFEDESLDFVYIDANHDYEHVLEDVTQWARKVRKGGVVAGHDYIKRKGQDKYYDVVRAVNDYADDHHLQRITIYRGDSPPSWMFIK